MTAQTPGGDGRSAPLPAAVTTESKAAALRQRVLDELAVVEGRIALAARLDAASAKEQLRLVHSVQRAARLADAAEFLRAKEPALLEHFADGREIVPEQIDPVVIPVRTPMDADLFRFATLQWSVPVSAGYGRRTRFLVRDRSNGKLIAIFALGDPVIGQGARDAAIGWTVRQRNERLYNVLDAFVLGAVEPYRQLLGGKLAALLTLANETRDYLTTKYQGNTTGIRGASKDPTPVLITTSSALGRSSIYNRVTYQGTLMFHSVGFTRGFGHFQFSDELFAALLDYVRDHILGRDAKLQSSSYGSGPNWRFRVIRTALRALGIPPESLQHNVKREIFLAPVAAGWDAFLRGESDEVDPFDLPAEKIGQYYRERWAIGRAGRRPGFQFWRPEEARLTQLLPEEPRQLALGLPQGPLYGRVDMGPYGLKVGMRRQSIRGRSPNGKRLDGSAYLSQLEGPGILITLADVTWSDGQREIRGWDLNSSPSMFEGLIGRRGIVVHRTERFRGMSMMELRVATANPGCARPSVLKVTSSQLSALLGFDIVAGFDQLAEATIGPRETLLREAGARKGQLCVVFRSDDTVVPAVSWCLTRIISLAVTADGTDARPAVPTLRRSAPRLDDLDVD